MTEWLTENANRAYPLEREWPDQLSGLWTPVLLDACVGYDGLPEDGRVTLLRVSKVGDAVAFRIGTSDDSYVDVPVAVGRGGRSTSYARGPHYKALLVTGDEALARAVAQTADGWSAAVNVPFALRCTSYANRRVTAIEAHSPEDPCARPVFSPETEHCVGTLSGDVVLRCGDGVDLDVVQAAPLSGDLLRVTAVTAPSDAADADRPVDMMIRGDECVAVESIPGYTATADGALVEDPLSGVVRLTEKCKPCCQCEDYEAAVNALRPGERATFSIQDSLDDARLRYDAAVALLDQVKELGLQKINDYDHVIRSAVAVASGGVTQGSSAEGTRCRIAVNLTVMCLTLEDVTVSDVAADVPGYAPVKVAWGKSGHAPGSGDSLSGRTWLLKPGDTLSVVVTFSRTSTTNAAVKPPGMSASMTLKLPSRDALTTSVEVL